MEDIELSITNPRGQPHYDVLTPIFTVLALTMDAKAKINRLKLFVTMSGKEVHATSAKRDDPIVGLTKHGKGMLHGKILADCITSAQEAMILLHVARSFYYRFRGDDQNNGVVTSQALSPNTGGSSSYKQVDVDYFRRVFKIIKEKREEDKEEEDHTLRFCHFHFPKEHAELLEATKKAKAAEEEAEAEAEAPAAVVEIQDDNSLGEDVDFD